MTDQETLRILQTIADNYQAKFKVNDMRALVRSWHKTLQHYEYEKVSELLDMYFAHNSFPPVLSDLVRILQEEIKAVPNAQQTRAMLEELATVKQPLSEEQISTHLAAIRKILSVKGSLDVSYHTAD